jgi:three-Cys-motif partner protein
LKKKFGREIGKWSEIKLKCIHKYLGAYSNILTHAGIKNIILIDGFASTGFCKSKQTSKTIRGSATLALTVKPPFSRYFFIELDKNKIKELEKLKKSFPTKTGISKATFLSLSVIAACPQSFWVFQKDSLLSESPEATRQTGMTSM